MKQRISLLATTLRTRPITFKQKLVARFAADILPLLAAGKMEHVIDREFHRLEAAHSAQEYMLSNSNAGKIVISLQGNK